MSTIIAGRFDTFSRAETAATRLRARGIRKGQWRDGHWEDFDPRVPPVPAGPMAGEDAARWRQ